MFRPKLAHSAHSYKSFKSVTLQRNTITVKRRFTNTQSFLDTIVRFEFWTLVANLRFCTLVADFRFWMLVANFRFGTLVADFRFWTLVADL